MGMNHYLRTKPCAKCGCIKTEKHIGKSSHGWQYNFRGYPAESIVSYKDWLDNLMDDNKEIVDENGDVFTLDEFLDKIASKNQGLNLYNVTVGYPMTDREKEYVRERQNINYKDRDLNIWKDDEGYAFSGDEFS